MSEIELVEISKERLFEIISEKNFKIMDLYQEIEILHSIIKEIREYIETIVKNTPSSTRKDYANMLLIDYKKLLEILDKENK